MVYRKVFICSGSFPTLVLSVIQQPLARFSIPGSYRSCTTTGIGHTSVPILRPSTLQRPVVLITSPRPQFSATSLIEVKPSFLRTYGVSLPSSLTMGLSTPESIRPAHQCRFRYGYESFELFLDQMDPVLSSQCVEKNPESGRPSKKGYSPSGWEVIHTLRIRLFHRWSTVLWNPCAYGDGDWLPEPRYSCQHAHSRVLQGK